MLFIYQLDGSVYALWQTVASYPYFASHIVVEIPQGVSAMNNAPFAKFIRLLHRAHPLPALASGFVTGLILALCLPQTDGFADLSLLPWSAAVKAIALCELPIAVAIAVTGITRLPALTNLPLFYRSLLWGYGSLSVFVCAGQSSLYFRYVLGCGLTLLPLCYMTRTAANTAASREFFSAHRWMDYLCRCLFYFGLVLLTIPLRLYGE